MAERAKAKRKSKSKANGSNGVGHNSGRLGGRDKEEIYARWLSKIEHADVIYQRANEQAKSRRGELRAIYAAAKEDGCNIDAIKEARAKHKLDHLTVAQDYDDMGLVLRVMQSPLATQLSLFEPVKRDDETTASMAGELAGRRGDPIDENPHTPGTQLYETWRAGHDRGQAALRETLRD